MPEMTAPGSFDAIPYAACAGWATNREYEAWWEDPRDLFEIVIALKPGGGLSLSDIAVSYWQHSWPEVRVPKGALVGSGRSGWLAIDDWTNGSWQEADIAGHVIGEAIHIAFAPVNRREFPDVEDFPATFRRTIKLRLEFARPAQAEILSVHALTDSIWREADATVEWRSTTGALSCRDGRLEAFNGEVLGVAALDDAVTMTDGGHWRSGVSGSETAGIRARIRYAANDDPNSYDRTIVTVRSTEGAFSFLMDDILHDDPLYVRDLGAFVALADSPHRMDAWEAQWQAHHPQKLHERIAALPEQTWENAWKAMPPKKRRLYFVLGCEGRARSSALTRTATSSSARISSALLPAETRRCSAGRGTNCASDSVCRLSRMSAASWRIACRSCGRPGIAMGCASSRSATRPGWSAKSPARTAQPGRLAGRHPGDDPVVCMARFRLTNLTGGVQHANLSSRQSLTRRTPKT
jgi:hypothetical protein